MEIIDDNYISDANYHHDSSNFNQLNNIEHLSSIFELGDHPCDESFNRSFENCSISDEYSSKMLDNVSEKTSSSIETEFEVMLHDYNNIVSCLSTDCYQRSDSDVAVLSQLLQSIPEFMCMNSNELELVCQSARLLVIDASNTFITRRYSKLEDWYFCLCGSLRKDDDESTILTAGNCIGAALGSQDVLISDYNLYSNCDNCKLLVISRDDLIPSKRQRELIIKTSDEDKTIVAVYEATLSSGNFMDNFGYVLSKGTPEVLINNLLSNPSLVHRDFVEDFFMTHKLYFPQTIHIMEEISNGLYEDLHESKEKFEILIRWMSQSFSEFEKDENKIKFINNIATILIGQRKQEMLYSLYECCSNNASTRNIKAKLSFLDNIVPVCLENERTIFYIDNINDHEVLKNGDVIISIEEYSQQCITKELIQVLCGDQKSLSISVRNDILGYHEHILKDISLDSCSLHSIPSNPTYDRCYSDKVSDTYSVSTNDSDTCSPNAPDFSPSMKKRPSLIPSFFSTLQTGTVGRFFKNPKHYSNLLKRKHSSGARPMTILPNNRSISDVSNDMNYNFQRPHNMSGSTMSIQRFSRRLKNQRKSAGSNPEIIRSFDDKDSSENESFLSWTSSQSNLFPIRIYWKEIFLGRSETGSNSSTKSELRCVHLMINSMMPVSEVIILTLLKLNVSSASSNQFYLVDVKVDEDNVIIHEKILKPTATNLRLKIHSRFYLKHNSFVGSSLILQKEADKMIKEFQLLGLLTLSPSDLVVRLFLRSHNLICSISPTDLISHVTSSKSTLRINKHHSQSESGFDKYIQLSDFYKNWVITEICSEQVCIVRRSRFIQYFIWLAYKALHIGHIDLFFSLISGLDSTEVSRLLLTWDKVSTRDKKLFTKLKSALNVSGNMRHLRSLHQKMEAPFIPVTAMVVKDLTMIEETNPTFVEGFINGLPVNRNLVNFDKMRKMAQLSRNFINSVCSCTKDKSQPVRKHLSDCTRRPENLVKLEKSLLQRMQVENQLHHINHSMSIDSKFNRKHSNSNISMKSSSSESISDSVSTMKNNHDYLICKVFEQQRMDKKIDYYLTKLEKIVIDDPNRLSEISLACEPSVQSNQNTLKLKSSKHVKAQDDLIIHHNHFGPNEINTNDISDKAAEILGLKTKAKIHIYKKSAGS